MLYTSYFAKLKSLPENIIPISICGKAPDWYKGLQYKKLAPKYDFFMEWKKNHDNDYYKYMESAVTAICKNSNKEEARKFINRKILYFDKNTEGQYTTEIVFKRLNAIVDNY